MFAKPKKDPAVLGFDELIELKRNLDLEIAGRQSAEIENLKTKVSTVTDALGISIAELFGIKDEAAPRRRKPVARIKYRDPAHPENTWTGKGKPPKWLQEKLDQGANKEQFQV